MTKRVKLTVAYDGTDFCGWAAQSGLRTVQSTLKEAVRQISGEDCEIVGASRTDSGTHARGQVCHFDIESSMPAEKWVGVMNHRLPPDVRVVRSQFVPEQFHSRFTAVDRWYRYSILKDDCDPFRMKTAFAQRRKLDLTEMRSAAEGLVGLHDFIAFTEELDPSVENTMRRLFEVKVSETKHEVRIDITGTAFLRGMMRRMAGCLYEIGRGAYSAERVKLLLGPERDEFEWPVVLPAKGLTLMRVRYGRQFVDHRKK